MKIEKVINDDSYVVGYCGHHDETVDQGTFEYKGCWTCHNYFRRSNWPYIDVKEAAETFGVCRHTIYRWIKKGKLKARLFVMGRTTNSVPKKFYAILPDQPRP